MENISYHLDRRAIYVFDCENKPIKGRFVTVRSVNVKQPLVLCEVKVRGYLWTCEFKIKLLECCQLLTLETVTGV